MLYLFVISAGLAAVSLYYGFIKVPERPNWTYPRIKSGAIVLTLLTVLNFYLAVRELTAPRRLAQFIAIYPEAHLQSLFEINSNAYIFKTNDNSKKVSEFYKREIANHHDDWKVISQSEENFDLISKGKSIKIHVIDHDGGTSIIYFVE